MMEINNKTELLEFLRRESLRILSESGESQALSALHDKVEDVEGYFIDTDEKRLERLNSDEEKAIDKEDYVGLQKIKEDKKNILGKLIVAYKKKIELYEQMRQAIAADLQDIGVKGSQVFKNKELNEFRNEGSEKGIIIKVGTLTSEITIQKISGNNQYKVMDSTAPGIQPGYIVAIPDLKIGNSAQLKVYRPMGDSRFEEIGSPTLQNIKKITKNPS